MALTTWQAFYAAHDQKVNQLPQAAISMKGIGTNDFYFLEVDPATGAIPVSGTFSFTPALLLEDHGYGTVSGTTTLRTASQIGNAAGAADFGVGVSGAQTLRVVIATGGATPIPTGAATAALQTALNAQIPTTLGQKNSANSLAVVLASDDTVPVSGTFFQTTQPVSGTVAANQSGAWSVGIASTGLDFGVSSSGLRVAALPGNATGIADFNAGTTGAQTPRTTLSADAAVFQAEGSIAFGSLTTSYATVFTAGGSMKIIQMRNSMNVPVQVSLDGGSTTHYNLESGDAVSIDLKSNGMLIANSTAIQAKYTGSAPTSGSIRVNGAH